MTYPAGSLYPSTGLFPSGPAETPVPGGRTKPPLGLRVEVQTPDGVIFEWSSNKGAESRPQNLSFGTKIGDGFSEGGLTLARRIDRDYPDLELANSVTFIGADGSIAYEGQMSAMPGELADHHSIGVTLTGWMAHAKDRKFSELYIDRDIGAWTGGSARRRSTLLTTGYGMVNGPDQKPDPSNNAPTVVTSFNGAWASGFRPIAEAWYDAGPIARIGQVTYTWERQGGLSQTDTNWRWFVLATSDDTLGSGIDSTANLIAAGPSSGNLSVGANKRWAVLQLYYNTSPAGIDGAEYGIAWSKLAVYGRPLAEGLPAYPGLEPGEPYGFYASDVIKDIAQRYCPLLDVSGVQGTNYPIAHLVFKDRVFPYDAFLEVNKYHLWHLGVWENRTLTFRPYDFTTHDWEIRTDDPGVTFSPQGPTVADLFNGIVVKYSDVLTGLVNVLTPDAYGELGEADPDNPWNRHSRKHWDEIELSSSTTLAQALQIGRAALEDRNRPRTPGTVTVKDYIRDRSGNWQQAWKVRAGDMLMVSNFPNDRPRLIQETSWDDESKILTISLEQPSGALDAVFDRIGNALGARGLT